MQALHIDGLEQKRRIFIVNALEWRLFFTNAAVFGTNFYLLWRPHQSTLTVQPPQEGTVMWSIDIFVIASCIIDLVTPNETLWRTSNVFFWTRLVDDAIVNDGIIKWKHIRRSWSFVQGIHRSPVNS